MNMSNSQFIINTVCRTCGVRVSKLLSPIRTGQLYFVRMLAVRFLAEAGETHETIGWLLNRTRPSISYTSKAQQREYEQNKLFRRQCEIIKSKLDEQARATKSV